MANTFTQIHIQVVFATQFRKAQISPLWESRLYEYIIGIFNFYGHRVLSINGMPDHIHILFGFNPDQSLSDLIQKVKASSSKWINEEKLSPSKFSWQAGFGAFSYTKSDVPKVIQYIQNQKEHHQKKTFLEEYKKILKDLEIEFDPRYIFKDLI
ncbi:IS200/IS605 family transposase [Algoriphagus sp. CAU 1675]|uniref:IS200/IS605 family transposase n=1 Tax=Algoriphagus sp. CAU 1675 TaxID=3032597 RepID=UPI0023DA38E8|nr:IS200/IS605 family transposase [Algoriphagus sp. CAU 1675]MDF2157648.1 IS200/IS605 family transposase [Algoriphagus sp. CAU 1675]